MIAKLKINIYPRPPRMEDAEPTGDPCSLCGDIPYLGPKNLVCRASINGHPFILTSIYMCASCADEVKRGPISEYLQP